MTETRMPMLVIRPAQANDVEQVADIERAAFADPWSRQAFHALIGRAGVCFDVVVERETPDRVAGYSVVYLLGYDADLANIAVAAAARRKGVGRHLLHHALDSARRSGAHDLYLEVRESNAAARALYAAEGFVEVGRRARYYVRPVEDALILRRTLE